MLIISFVIHAFSFELREVLNSMSLLCTFLISLCSYILQLELEFDEKLHLYLFDILDSVQLQIFHPTSISL